MPCLIIEWYILIIIRIVSQWYPSKNPLKSLVQTSFWLINHAWSCWCSSTHEWIRCHHVVGITSQLLEVITIVKPMNSPQLVGFISQQFPTSQRRGTSRSKGTSTGDGISPTKRWILAAKNVAFTSKDVDLSWNVDLRNQQRAIYHLHKWFMGLQRSRWHTKCEYGSKYPWLKWLRLYGWKQSLPLASLHCDL